MSEFDSSLIGQRQQRLAKLNDLVGLGFNPYPAKSKKSHSNLEITEDYAKLEGQEVAVSGRLMTWREHGALRFADLQDASGQIQLYFKLDEFGQRDVDNQTLGWDDLNLIDAGDFVEATGIVTKTERGEISVLVRDLKIASKSIRPLPDKWQGLQNVEERFRRRYLDMTMNPEVRARFERRGKFWSAIRQFLVDNDFVEINIPVLEHVTGGADAKPFVTHYDALKQDFYLRISHELPLKRLIGAGYERVFDIGPRFRNEGFSDEHLPEHIAMEWYWAYADYRDGMKFTTEMFRYVMQEVYGTLKFNMKGFEVDLGKEWEEIYFVDVIKERFDVDIFEDSVQHMNEILKQNGVDLGEDVNKSRVVDNLWKLIRKTIAGPAFLLGVPKFLSPLAKTNTENELLTDRFHPVIAGSELANAFSELNDPQDQLARFVEQQRMRESGDDEAHMLDIDYVEMLEYGMPPAVGFGLSERVFWFFEDVSAKEGVPFPQLKSDLDNITLKIYDEIKDLLISEETEAKSEKSNSAKDNSATGEVKPHDHSKKMVLVLNQELEGWQLTNTIGHLTAYLGAEIGKQNLHTREKFEVANGESINTNAQYAVITMKAKSSTQLYNLLQKVEEKGLVHLAYIQEMIDFNDDNELQEALKNQAKDQLNYLGIGIFGNKEDIDKLTKKFSLWR